MFAGKHCNAPDVIRDYRAESAAPLIANLARERTRGGDAYWRDQFLPTAAELAGPGDPDGSKGIRKWNDEHDPREGNSKPLRPEGPKQVY